MCTLTQFWGAGKTSLLRNYAQRLTNPDSAAAIAKAYEDRFCAGEKQDVAHAESKAVLAATDGMRATIVDCKNTVDETLRGLATKIASTWQFSLADCTTESPFQKFQVALERARTLGPVFIGLDEVFNFGRRPTYPKSETPRPVLEMHLLGFKGANLWPSDGDRAPQVPPP